MKPLIKGLIAIMVTGGIVGGATYFVVNKKATTDKNNLQTQIDDISRDLSDTKTALATAWEEANTVIKNSTDSTTTTTATTTSVETVTVRNTNLQNLTGEKTTLGDFQTIIYKDFTGDGNEDALVRFTHLGTGSFVDFFIYGVVNNQVKELYSKKDLFKGQVSTVVDRHSGLSIVTAVWIDPDSAANVGKPNSDLTSDENTSKQYQWDGSKFVESYMQ